MKLQQEKTQAHSRQEASPGLLPTENVTAVDETSLPDRFRPEGLMRGLAAKTPLGYDRQGLREVEQERVVTSRSSAGLNPQHRVPAEERRSKARKAALGNPAMTTRR